MQNKVVLITGGSSGIGKSIGIYLKSKQFKVYGTTRSLSRHADFTAFELLELDVRKTDGIESAIHRLIELEGRVDVLINNAGVGITGPLEETPHDQIVNAFDVNFHGPLRMIKAVLPQMREQKYGLIINITSIAGYMGLPYRGVYSASKGALEIITEALRMETKEFGVQITNLAPGDFATNIAAGRYHVKAVKGSPYVQYARTLEAINDGVDDGEDPIEVAKKVFKIIRTQKPRIHYKVGAFSQKISVFLKKILPEKVFEKMLLNHYKL
ncbi:SDR family oxidoreductase [Flavobacteriaceae bacterium TP-CH-4]|uniref:SDR family oxidoreductase n=1 Tax=Pelagihabitans pacificus TaxID=2696054 RepID=A0A967E6K6_9FLAO|nr:SDR family oxidoreductase [Pelagihabitans pacificus]NHF59269.1 SDR family oxidoreductase [Pelagihabitans pacificus]